MENSLVCSVVIPVYNSENCLEKLVSTLFETFTQLSVSFELILVNDGSHDNSQAVIERLVAQHPFIKGIELRKNFGQDNALMAGLRHARGGYIVIMDDDLQHDPKYIGELLQTIAKGYDVVYANYSRHKHQRLWKNMGSWFNDKIADIVLKKPPEIYLSPFKIISQSIVSEIITYTGAYPYIDGLIFRLTRNISQIFIEHRDRVCGKSTYSIIKSLLVWSNLTTNFSIFPLRIASVLGLTSAIGGLLFAIIFLVNKFLDPTLPVGWTSIFISIQIIGGVQLFAIGILGEYIGRTFLNINRQPQYSIRTVTIHPPVTLPHHHDN